MSDLLVGSGGLLGSSLRYLFSGHRQGILNGADFPYDAIIVNLTGYLIVGYLSQLAERQIAFTLEPCAFLLIGLLGGGMTSSTFGNETTNLLRSRQLLDLFHSGEETGS